MRQFIPQSYDFFPDFTAAAVNATAAAALLRAWLTDGVDLDQGPALHALEHRGDELTHGIHAGLQSGFIPPLDRADILDLTDRLDDFVDAIEEAGQRFRLYRLPAGTAQAIRFAAIAEEQARTLAEAMPLLATPRQAATLLAHAVAVHRLENEADDLFDGVLAALYDGVEDVQGVIRGRRWGEVYALLEATADTAEGVAHTLENIAGQWL